MKITDPRVMKTTAIATVVICAAALGYVGALAHHSMQDWIVLASLTIILACSLFTMLHEVWKQNA
jgi:membrane protein YdbS with pleckstrin-like domain